MPAIAIRGSKITAEMLVKALRKFVEELEKAQKDASRPKTYKGKPVSYTHLDVYKRQGYDRWAAKHNLKQMAATVTAYQQYGFSSPEELDEALSLIHI